MREFEETRHRLYYVIDRAESQGARKSAQDLRLVSDLLGRQKANPLSLDVIPHLFDPSLLQQEIAAAAKRRMEYLSFLHRSVILAILIAVWGTLAIVIQEYSIWLPNNLHTTTPFLLTIPPWIWSVPVVVVILLIVWYLLGLLLNRFKYHSERISAELSIELQDIAKKLMISMSANNSASGLSVSVAAAIQVSTIQLQKAVQTFAQNTDAVLDKFLEINEKAVQNLAKISATQAAVPQEQPNSIVQHEPDTKYDFDVYLCYNTQDQSEVQAIAEKLKMSGISPWLDIWELQPGMQLQKVIEQQLSRIKAVAVFIGDNGLGPWQDSELRGVLRESVERNMPVIPVILPECAQAHPELPAFLKSRQWVDFRQKSPDPLQALVWGILGRRETV